MVLFDIYKCVQVEAEYYARFFSLLFLMAHLGYSTSPPIIQNWNLNRELKFVTRVQVVLVFCSFDLRRFRLIYGVIIKGMFSVCTVQRCTLKLFEMNLQSVA